MNRIIAFFVAALVLFISACATGTRRSDVSRDPGIDARSSRLTSLPRVVHPQVVNVELDAAAFAPDKVKLAIHLPPGYDLAAAVEYPVLYFNDGQDSEAVGMVATLARLHEGDAIEKIIVVAVNMLPDRIGTYGLSDRAAQRSVVGDSRFGPVGNRAQAYSQWFATELVPYIDANYRTRRLPAARSVLGWSLGGLNAFNLGWQYPEVFGQVGAFSPSFWLPSDLTDAASAQRTRLAQGMVEAGPKRAGSRFWFAVGTAEETDDRDGDDVIDAVDDTLDLGRGLARLGYSVNLEHALRPSRSEDVAFHLLPDGQHNQASWARMLPLFLQWAYGKDAVAAPRPGVTGRVEHHPQFPSRHVDARNVDVWLPPGYGDDPARRYPVLYMHDGQNLFDPELSYGGTHWGVDEAMTRLIGEGRVRAAIVVGVWNTPKRMPEYMPEKAVRQPAFPMGADDPNLQRKDPVSDDYLAFLVRELKPFIDARYRTLDGRDDTFLMGSSMGGLISAYAVSEYPQVFGGAGCISTHWPAGDGAVIDYLAKHLPDPRTHKFYFDYGTETLDASYAPYQHRMDAALRNAGYQPGAQWVTRRFEGAEHSEKSWRARLEAPLLFLLGK
ncbi:MAG TPA: alpha/beta hydrolase-fold protein [Pseudoxanthomonas sp.]